MWEEGRQTVSKFKRIIAIDISVEVRKNHCCVRLCESEGGKGRRGSNALR